MGKSNETKQVNSDLENRYKMLNSGNSPYDRFQNTVNDKYASDSGNAGGFLNNAYGRFNDYANNGGVSADNANRIRGNGVFDKFAKNGGLGAADRANIRSRAGSANVGLFSSLRDRLATQNNVQGGINPGYNAQMAKMARDQGHAAADSSLDTEIGIKDAVNKGKQWGASSMSDAERALLGATQHGQEFGMSGISHLFDTQNANSNEDIGNLLKAIGMNQQEIDQMLGARAERNPNKSGFSQFISPLIGAGGGILGSLLMGGGDKKQASTGSGGGTWV